ncbi:hypothetical protein M9H77_04643 [Catharanthus roseus]|uniref:Uncharacterized protein n=1 Tax=Catharanthus roseus TaxID=4058 RepID=A0ACC0CEU4_CATRO|nr:hypothetical protein M9H77_04643 [Catharanthus roseus]
MQSSPLLSLSPSFTSYSSSRLAEIAARVVDEFRDQDEEGFDEGFSSFCTNFEDDLGEKNQEEEIDEGFSSFCAKFEDDLGEKEEEEKIVKVEDGGDDGEGKEEDGDEEFEFAFVAKDSISSPTPADEIFYNGQIRPIYPVFDTSLLFGGVDREKDEKSKQKPPPIPEPVVRLPLRKLFIEERESYPSSCSSSEADELDGVAPETYCVWNPKSSAGNGTSTVAEVHCKKSNSTGSSKRWRFRDLLHRSSSDGKDRFVFLTHSNSHNGVVGKKREGTVEKSEKIGVASVKVTEKIASAQCGAQDGGERRRVSFLPYRQDLVGLFSNVNGLNRNLHPF